VRQKIKPLIVILLAEDRVRTNPPQFAPDANERQRAVCGDIVHEPEPTQRATRKPQRHHPQGCWNDDDARAGRLMRETKRVAYPPRERDQHGIDAAPGERFGIAEHPAPAEGRAKVVECHAEPIEKIFLEKIAPRKECDDRTFHAGFTARNAMETS